MTQYRLTLKYLLINLLVFLPIHGFAQPYSKIVVFGDSLSDTGNVANATFGILPGAGYADGRFSNGPVWVEYLSPLLGLSYNADDNYAWGGAESGTGGASAGPISVLGVTSQVVQFLVETGNTADPDALYIIMVGGNDLMGEVDENSSATDIDNVVNQTVANIVDAANMLASAGAIHIVASGIDVSITPRAMTRSETGRQNWQTASTQFNQALATALANLATPVAFFDLATSANNILANAESFGLTNTNSACLMNAQLCDEPGAWFFMDEIHPTTAIHKIIADEILSVVAVPSFSTNDLQLRLPAVTIPGNEGIVFDLVLAWDPIQANLTLLSGQIKTSTSQMRVQQPVAFDGEGMTVDVLVDNTQTLRVRLTLLPDVDVVRLGVALESVL